MLNKKDKIKKYIMLKEFEKLYYNFAYNLHVYKPLLKEGSVDLNQINLLDKEIDKQYIQIQEFQRKYILFLEEIYINSKKYRRKYKDVYEFKNHNYKEMLDLIMNTNEEMFLEIDSVKLQLENL